MLISWGRELLQHLYKTRNNVINLHMDYNNAKTVYIHRNCIQGLKLRSDFCASCSVALFNPRNLMILDFQWFVDWFLARLDAGWKAADDQV